jgi:hypothetical protein
MLLPSGPPYWLDASHCLSKYAEWRRGYDDDIRLLIRHQQAVCFIMPYFFDTIMMMSYKVISDVLLLACCGVINGSYFLVAKNPALEIINRSLRMT